MCCIFTCCGWMIDIVQRVWVFAMSCCISSAVCCVLITSSMSGVALGYNYSLAEYIDLKETNISVYVKRGVFDDDVADDMDWRRRGGRMPIKGALKDDGDLLTGAPGEGEQLSLRSGRRLEDSILDSDSQQKFEGSLMKLTAKPPHPSTTTRAITSDMEMQEIVSKFTAGSLDQMKAIQGLINMRKSMAVRDSTVKGQSTYGYDERYLPHLPAFPDSPEQGRRMMNLMNGPGLQHYTPKAAEPLKGDIFNLPLPINPARLAVPDRGINGEQQWIAPKLPPDVYRRVFDNEVEDENPKYPAPMTPRPGPIRPTRATFEPTHTPRKLATYKIIEGSQKPVDRKVEDFKESMLLDKDDNLGNDLKSQKGLKKTDLEYYDEDIKGLPVRKRKRRSIGNVNSKLYPQAKATEKTVIQKSKPNIQTKLKIVSNIRSKVVDSPSILMSKLQLANKVANYISSDEKKERTKGVEIRENEIPINIDTSTVELIKILQSMFSS